MLDDELRTLVSTAPAPDLAARVRQRVAVDRARRRLPHEGLALAAALLVVVLAGGAYLITRTDTLGSPDGPDAPQSIRAGGSPAAERAVPLPSQRLDVQAGFRRAVASVALAPSSDFPPASASTGVTAGENAPPAVRIDAAERLALQRLFASPPRMPLLLPQPNEGDLIIPELRIAPIAVDDISEGARP